MNNFFEIQDALIRAALGNVTENVKSIYYQIKEMNNEIILIVFTKKAFNEEDDEYMQILITEFESFFENPMLCKVNYHVFKDSFYENEVLTQYDNYHGLFLLK